MPSRPLLPPSAGADYGPQTEVVERFLARFAELPTAEWLAVLAREMARGGRPTHTKAVASALGVAWRIARTAMRSAALDDIEYRCTQLGLARGRAEEPTGLTGAGELLEAAVVAEWAAVALLVRDRLEAVNPDAFELLYEPLAAAVPLEELRAAAGRRGAYRQSSSSSSSSTSPASSASEISSAIAPWSASSSP